MIDITDVTLVIPAKNESESLPKVLDELKKFEVKKLVVMSENDTDTFNSIKSYDAKVFFKQGKVLEMPSEKELNLLILNIFVCLTLTVHLIQMI